MQTQSTYSNEYTTWKNWTNETFGSLSKSEERYFAGELKKIGAEISPNSSVLEIGFGKGCFMGYAREKGWRVSGIEANLELVNMAKNHGYKALHADDFGSIDANQFDLISAFDVLEHIPQGDILNFLSEIKRVMKDGGVFIARFPNGDSPFGLANQNGDLTHVTAIGSEKFRYLVQRLNLELIFIGKEYSTRKQSFNPFKILRWAISSILKKMLNSFLNYILYTKREYLSANLVGIFRVKK
jgi:SAM-dependent methyltransferase